MATRPTRFTLIEGQQAWDGEVDANFAMITQAPLPLHVEDTVVGLTSAFSPSEYENCICIVDGKQYISNGASWEKYYPVAASVVDSVATTTAEMASDLNDLLASLRTAGIMEAS